MAVLYPPKPTSAGKATMIALGSVQVPNGGGGGNTGTIALTNPPTMGTANQAIPVAGTVTPSGTGVQVGLSVSSSTAPGSWTAATVSGGGWTASVTPSTAGTYYIWAQQTATPAVSVVSAAVTVSGSAPSTLTYSAIAGSGDGSLASITVTAGSAQTNWGASVPHGSTTYNPAINVNGATATLASQVFWWDTNATNTTKGAVYANSAGISAVECFWYTNTQYTPPTGLPPAPTAGTYYAKYACYDTSNNLMGVITTSAITVT